MRILSGDHLIFAIAKKIIGSESAKSVPMKQAVQSWCEDKVESITHLQTTSKETA